MTAARILLVSALLLLAGCQSGPEGRNIGWIGQSLPDSPINLAKYQPPKKLDSFRYQGEMSFPEREMRVFRYQQGKKGKHKLDVALYPLPPGWSDLSGERAVAGHYGQVKQTMAKRVARRHDSAVELVAEQLRKPAELNYPVAEGIFRERTDDWTRTLVLQISARRPVFVRITSNFRGARETMLPRIRAAMDAFLRQARAAGHNDG